MIYFMSMAPLRMTLPGTCVICKHILTKCPPSPSPRPQTVQVWRRYPHLLKHIGEWIDPLPGGKVIQDPRPPQPSGKSNL